jgi:uncharacterized protein YecT (DUF1311 family)
MPRVAPLLITSAIFFGSSAVHALGPECNDPKEGSTLSESCALQQELEGLDFELNDIYKKLLLQWKSTDFKNERTGLVASQRAWISYRDTTCAFEQAVYGGIVSISYSRCVVRVVGQRVAYLKELLS